MSSANQKNWLLRGGRVIDPAAGTDQTADVLILDGNIVETGPGLEVSGDLLTGLEVVDASGLWVTPGWIDMHVHLREPGEEYKETVETGTAAAAAGGFTAVACMPNTRPVNDCAAVTELILSRARERGSCRVYPVGAISVGLKGENMAEFGELRDAGAVGVTDDGRPVMNNMLMRRALEYSSVFGLRVISHSEDLTLSGGGLMNEGPVAALLGLRGIPAAAEKIMIARDVSLAALTGVPIHIAHVSTTGAIQIIREAKEKGTPVTAETAPHYFTLTDDKIMDFDPVYKVNPPIRNRRDLEAIKEGLRDGTLDAVATDHAPHSEIEKDTEFEIAACGMIGLETAMPLLLGLVREGVLSPLEAVAKVTVNPARILGVPGGQLKPGSPADVTVIDPGARYTIDAGTFRSKSRNCPFNGWEVQGRAVLTLLAGRAVHRA